METSYSHVSFLAVHCLHALKEQTLNNYNTDTWLETLRN